MNILPDRQTVMVSAARTASANSDDQVAPPGARGLRVIIDVTADPASASIVFTIAMKELISGSYISMLASAAVTGTGETVLTIYPGCVAVANSILNQPAPAEWRLQAVAADSDSMTYSASAEYLA